MSHVEQPAPTGLAALVHERDGLVDARIRLHAGRTQIVERPEHVVVPERRKRELRPRRLDDVAGGQPPDQTTREQILLRATPRRR